MRRDETTDREPSAEADFGSTARSDASLSESERSYSQGGRAEQRHDRLKWIVPVHTLAGIVLGVLLLHPVTMVIYHLEMHPNLADSSILQLVASRMGNAFMPPMWPMTGAFALIGALLGVGSGLHSRANTKNLLLVSRLDRRMGKTTRLLVAAGENDAVEFKSSLRWDHRQEKCNKALEMVVVKTIAGFLNHDGGDLLIGVADDGSVVGLAGDYATLKKKDRDGFELLLMQLVKNTLGADVCTLLHTVFQEIDGQDVCRVLIESSERPVYVQHGGRALYFVRTGNSTHELDTKEALDHITRRAS